MSKILIAYFSASGVTRKIATDLSEVIKADLFEITPKVPYTSEDLNWTNKESRSSLEMNDENARPEIVNSISKMTDYNTVLIGFPVWWYVAPRIINTFIESIDLKDKKVVPFCTSGGSGIKSCEDDLKKKYPNINWQEGKRLTGRETKEDIEKWLY